MEIRTLRYFLTVAREENITKAANFLHISQPSLSVQLQELEKEIGKKLLIRGKRKITLTDDGILLRKRAEEILSLVEKTEHELSDNEEKVTGIISIGSGETKAINELLQIAKQLNQEYPNIQYNLFNGDAEAVTDQLDKGLLDFGILIEPVDIKKYERIRLNVTDTWGVLMLSSNPLSKKECIEFDDLPNLPLITPKRLGLQQEISSWIKKDFESLNVVATYNFLFNAILLVQNGFGNAIILNSLVDTKQYKELCFRPLSPKMEVNFSLVWKKYQVFSKPAEKLLELLNKNIRTND